MERDEDKILIAQTEDKIRTCSEQYVMTHTAFLDMRQATLAEKAAFSAGARRLLFGGYPDAERRVMIFLPDYMSKDDALDPDNCPLSLLKVSVPKGSKPLTHRDYLGSLMNLGIKREVLGDIIVRSGGADIVILKEMEDYLMSSWARAGRNNLSVSAAALTELDLGELRTEEIRDTVASLRLDAVISSVFRLSRGKAQEAVRQGLIYVNGIQCLKPDAEVEAGDKLVLRGKGKAVLREAGGLSRKGRIGIRAERYL